MRATSPRPSGSAHLAGSVLLLTGLGAILLLPMTPSRALTAITLSVFVTTAVCAVRPQGRRAAIARLRWLVGVVPAIGLALWGSVRVGVVALGPARGLAGRWQVRELPSDAPDARAWRTLHALRTCWPPDAYLVWDRPRPGAVRERIHVLGREP